MKQITPLPPQEEKPESIPDRSDSQIEPTLPEDAVLVLPEDEPNAMIEGQFEEVPSDDILQIEEPKKRKTKPAIFALFTILALIVLCCLMSIIIFFMVRPAMLESNTVGALFPSIKDLLSLFK